MIVKLKIIVNLNVMINKFVKRIAYPFMFYRIIAFALS